jgi:phosphatidylinositol alpha 1,6-mannosyltransferase
MIADDRAPRVLYCTDTYPPQVNGVSVVTSLSVNGLRERGWQCAVVAPAYGVPVDPASADPYPITAIPSVALPVYPDIRLAAPDYWTIATAIRVFRPDLVHCATEFVIGALGQYAARNAGIPVVSSYHTDFGRYATAYGVPWLRGVITSYISHFHRRSVRTYTPSVPARDDLRRMGVASVEVWGRAVDTHLFHPSRRSRPFMSAYGLDDRMVFLHVGRLAAEKGVDCILTAFQLARQALPARTIHLIVAGAGPEEQRLRAGAPPDVTFLGVLDREKTLPKLYASADAFLFSSLTETLGLVVLEAMASGLPVIATPAGGVADHLRDDLNGIAVPPSDPAAMAQAIVALVLDRARRDRLAAGARRTAEPMGWDAELDRLERSYRDVAELGVQSPTMALAV